LAFAVTAAHEVKRVPAGRRVEDLSEEALYWGCKRTDGNRRKGTSFSSGNVALGRWGQPLEAMVPYDATRDDTKRSVAPAGAGGPGWFKGRLRHVAVGVVDLKAEINVGNPVAIGLLLTGGFYVARLGRIPAPVPGEKTLGGHAVTLVGYDERGTAPLFTIRNSWGVTWGDHGYGYLPYGYQALFKEAWAIE
jgi:Papain family cysteine protease